MSQQLNTSSKTKAGLQVDAPDGASGGERPALQRVRLIKKFRSEDAAGIAQIYFVENVARVHGEREVISPIGTRAAHHRSAAEQGTTWTTTAAVPSETRAAGPRIPSRSLCLRAETEGFAQAQIQDSVRGSSPVIDGGGRNSC